MERLRRKLGLGFEHCEFRLMLHGHVDAGGNVFSPGDANRDGAFDELDLIQVLQRGEYEDATIGNSTWEDGDWNGDAEFDRLDLILALQAGNYGERETLYPNVLAAEAVETDEGIYRFSVTLSSPYDTPDRYADAWRVLTTDGVVLGIRELAHDHQHEQPFTRRLSGVAIPEGVDNVVVQGRDQISGWGGDTVTVSVP